MVLQVHELLSAIGLYDGVVLAGYISFPLPYVERAKPSMWPLSRVVQLTPKEPPQIGALLWLAASAAGHGNFSRCSSNI